MHWIVVVALDSGALCSTIAPLSKNKPRHIFKVNKGTTMVAHFGFIYFYTKLISEIDTAVSKFNID